MPWLFSYGTLQKPSVQLATFGRLLSGGPDALPGFERRLVRIVDPAVLAVSGEAEHPMLCYSGTAADQVSGSVFELSEAELAQADAYEVEAYLRCAVRLLSGRVAWAYVDREHPPPDQGVLDQGRA